MSRNLFFLTIPGLRDQDWQSMPKTQQVLGAVNVRNLQHSFPAVTWPSQANMLTGRLPSEHGVVANGLYWRDKQEVEMWTAWNEVIEFPQLWDVLKSKDGSLATAAWFPMLSKGCGADYVCMPAPIHKPDGSEEMWCYTKPQPFYGELLEKLEHFPLHHFWGPLANIKSSTWIADSAVAAAQKFQPNFFYVYLPHLDYQAQKFGPNSEQALQAVTELDELLGRFIPAISSVYEDKVDWIIASEYVIQEVSSVTYPNRLLREHGLLNVKLLDGLEHLDLDSPAWTLVDHQFGHVFVRDRDPAIIEQVVNLFENTPGIASVATGDQRAALNLDHERSGDVILVSEPDSWQAYYWWNDDELAPAFARNVDIHQKPGYDPVEMFMNMQTRQVPLDASMIRGSHGVPCEGGVVITSNSISLPEKQITDTDMFDIVVNHFDD